MSRNASTRSTGGFTLVELLVVVSIIALLLAMLLPALGAARVLAKDVVCMTNTRQQAMATRAYTNDFQGFLPAFRIHPDSGDWPKPNPWNDMRSQWNIYVWDVLREYIPADHDLVSGKQRQTWICPTYTPPAGLTGGYGQNTSDLDSDKYLHRFTFKGKSGSLRTFKVDTLEFPANYVLTGDAGMYTTRAWGASQILYWDVTDRATMGGFRHGLKGTDNLRDFRPRQDLEGKANYAFTDGHAETLGTSDEEIPEFYFRQRP